MAIKKHLPPPTKFGSVDTVLPKKNNDIARTHTSPSPTKFTPISAAQAKNAVSVLTRPQLQSSHCSNSSVVLPGKFPSQYFNGFVDPGKSHLQNDKGNLHYKRGRHVLQMMNNRIYDEQGQNFLSLPDTDKTPSFRYISRIVKTRGKDGKVTGKIFLEKIPVDEYQDHVCLRICYYAKLMVQVGYFLQWAKKQGENKSFKQVTSDKAESQVGVGVYIKNFIKVDAAHLSNSSIRGKEMLSRVVLTDEQQEALKKLRKESGATTPQLKSNNVGPDKVIDTCMSDFRFMLDAFLNAGSPMSGCAIIKHLGDKCIYALEAKAKTKKEKSIIYKSAISGIKNAQNSPPWNPDTEGLIWAKKNDFA